MDSQAIIDNFRAKYGLDRPIMTQYFSYWRDLFRMDLGVSLSSYPQPVAQMIRQALPWSVGLLTTATLIAFSVGSVLGALLAWPRSGRVVRTLVPALLVLATIPFYLLAMILIYLFAVAWRVFPPGGGFSPTLIMQWNWPSLLDIQQHALLPGLAIVLGSVGLWALGMRSQTVSVLGEDYITFAEAKGLAPRRIFLRYGMRNALLPQVTALALSMGHVVSGAVLVEVIFNYPGLGALLYNAVRGQDYFLTRAS
jgi:peptide/nickel transport system permease protein